MVLPTKRLEPDRALLTLGAEILEYLTEPKTVSRLWDELMRKKDNGQDSSVITYDWFILGLDFLYALGTIDLEQGKIRRVST
jgi:hypothetical protein